MHFNSLAAFIAASNIVLGVSAGPLAAKRQGELNTNTSDDNCSQFMYRCYYFSFSFSFSIQLSCSQRRSGREYHEQWRGDNFRGGWSAANKGCFRICHRHNRCVRDTNTNRGALHHETFKKLVFDKEYEKTEPYEGVWHPFTGQIQQYGLAAPVGWVLWGFSKMPSWLPMILISFLSRSFM